MNRTATLVIISSPSAGGKTVVVNELLKILPRSTRFLGTTTRKPRPEERDGVDYHFIAEEEFERKKQAGDFIEHAEYAGNLYGTDRVQLEKMRPEYGYIFFPIEVRGKRSFDKKGVEHVSIFIMPEPEGIIEKRLKQRGADPKDIKRRLKTAKKEIKQAKKYDYIVKNADGRLHDAVHEIVAILQEKGIDNLPNP